jgi:hypothetical protein
MAKTNKSINMFPIYSEMLPQKLYLAPGITQYILLDIPFINMSLWGNGERKRERAQMDQ